MSERAGAPVLIAARRTPIGRAGGALRHLTAADLAAPVLAAVHVAAGSPPLDEVVLGNCMGPGGDVARIASLGAGLGTEVPGLTVDRQCGSGLAAVTTAVALVRSGARVVLAGGAESASTAPWRSWPPAHPEGLPRRYERAPFTPAGFDDPEMGVAADLLAQRAGISRADQELYAARSHARAVAAAASGTYDRELVTLEALGRDERPRASITPHLLARLPTAFRSVDEGATVTAGTSSGINDGAAALAVVDAEVHARSGLPGLEVLACATTGCDPAAPGLGLVTAVRAVLDQGRMTLDDVDVVEFVEAFAAQVLACCAELDLPPERVCPQGGALALGHPWGASGAVVLVRLHAQLLQLSRPGAVGLAAVSVGGGQGVAMLVRVKAPAC